MVGGRFPESKLSSFYYDFMHAFCTSFSGLCALVDGHYVVYSALHCATSALLHNESSDDHFGYRSFSRYLYVGISLEIDFVAGFGPKFAAPAALSAGVVVIGADVVVGVEGRRRKDALS